MTKSDYSSEISEHQRQIARDSLERYCGCHLEEFGSYLLLTNFPRYVDDFAKLHNAKVYEGSAFKVAHDLEQDISIIDFKIGSPAAALVIDCCAVLPFKATLHLGMCGGLRRSYKVGDWFVPVASIRGEGTSDFYFPPPVPAMANFLVQRAVVAALEEEQTDYHVGICHTTNKRFWEFNEGFKDSLMASRAQAIDMESATLFCASYSYKLPTGALYLISDKPLDSDGIKTKASSAHVLDNFTHAHVAKGIAVINKIKELKQQHAKGDYRGEP